MTKKKLNLSGDQEKALEELLSWFKDKRPSYITLGGYAGTGKTTLISFFRKFLYKEDKKLKIAFASFTGKASQVLRETLTQHKAIYKGDNVSTIHSLIYSPITNDKEVIIGWEKKDDLKFDLIIVDEASMIDKYIWTDLASYNIPIVAVGDHGQLPPIRGEFNLMKDPDIKLEEIHRQAKGNPIIQLSIEVRKSGNIPYGQFSSSVMKIKRREAGSDIEDMLASYDKNTFVLCGYNNTRVKLNQYIRGLLDFESPIPSTGDRVICLRNNHNKGIFNGMLGTIHSIEKTKSDDIYFAIILLDSGDVFTGKILADQFNSKSSLNFTKKRRKTIDTDLFDFGYAMTVHKSQGGQAQKVILFEERFRQMNDDMWQRWLYTGVTRSQEELYVIA